VALDRVSLLVDIEARRTLTRIVQGC